MATAGDGGPIRAADHDGASADAGASARALYAQDPSAVTFGIELLAASPERSVVRMRVREEFCNGFGMLHGGMTFLLADSAMAFASNAAVGGTDGGALASSAEIDWLAPVRVDDVLTATAERRWAGGRSALWDVTVANAEGVAVALMRGRTRTVTRTVAG